MEVFGGREPSPLSSMTLDIVALNDRVLELRKAQMEEEIKLLDTQRRVNRLMGAMSDLTQRLELKAGKRNADTSREEIPA